MKLEDQVVSLELAQKLRELGVKQDSYFYWCMVSNPAEVMHAPDGMDEARINDHFGDGDNRGHWVYYSAFTVAELGEMLPMLLEKGQRFWLEINKHSHSGWQITYMNQEHLQFMYYVADFNFANAMAKMLIYLIENKLLDVNKLK